MERGSWKCFTEGVTLKEKWSARETVEKRAFQVEGRTWIKVQSGACLGTYKLFDMFWEHNIGGEWWEMNLESWAGHKL